ncbi:MAG: CDGSH iron-sulfur domain-containing protein [Prevotellaceae bacterium]|nr:CDGSH iron-sulfur domain-containing protein [Prevotellaceae bacterium]
MSYYTNDGKTPVSHKKETGEKASEWISVEIIENGPLYLFGNVRIKDKRKEETIREEKAAFCRCGASRDKPFCDGSHLKINFKG